MTVTGLLDDLIAALAGVADQLPEVPPGTKLDPTDRLDVRGSQHIAHCPAAVAWDGETDFEAGPTTVAWELAAHAGDRLVNGSTDPRSARRPTTPAGAVAVAVDETADNWAFDWWVDADDAARRIAEGAVVRRLAGVARMANSWPPQGTVTYGHRPTWSFPQRPLRLIGRVDLVLGRRGHDHTLVVALGGDHGPATRARLAYEALVETVALRRAPAKVLGLLPDAGRRWSLAVDGALLTEGVAVAALAARTALGARRRDASRLERRVGAACRHCEHRGRCPEGETWVAGPGRLRSGFLPPPSANNVG